MNEVQDLHINVFVCVFIIIIIISVIIRYINKSQSYDDASQHTKSYQNTKECCKGCVTYIFSLIQFKQVTYRCKPQGNEKMVQWQYDPIIITLNITPYCVSIKDPNQSSKDDTHTKSLYNY